MNKENGAYYLGLDIGTNSVGYAAASPDYHLRKVKGEPVWGVHLFETASLAEGRRSSRTARRRLDRRQQRVCLLNNLFAPEILKIDPNFFIRRKESALFPEDSSAGVHIFEGGITDREYHKRYPTIHHLIVDLMHSAEIHDVRLVYLACAWLVANRGHFLYDTASDVGNFSVAYEAFRNVLQGDREYPLPWPEATSPDVISSIMEAKIGKQKKLERFTAEVYSGKKLPKKELPVEEGGCPYSREMLVKLLCGSSVAPKDLFLNDAYAGIDSISLDKGEEDFARIVGEMGEDGDLLLALRGMYDCVLLNAAKGSDHYISQAKVRTYDQHSRDLAWLKRFARKYDPVAGKTLPPEARRKASLYDQIFRAELPDNYAAYAYHVKDCKTPTDVKGKAKKEDFYKFLKKAFRDIQVLPEDAEAYQDMLRRMELGKFMPKQKETDNRIIPQQLYQEELRQILKQAEGYLPFLSEKDGTGLTVSEKICAIFCFRIPYFVGPLNQAAPNSWVIRKPGRITPWNFEEMVDLDASEARFIRKMTNQCTYLPGEDVLPENSLIYSRFVVLNELNNLKVNGQAIPVAVKQSIYNDLFVQKSRKVTAKTIRDYLSSRGLAEKDASVEGIDESVKHTLKTFHSFRRMLDSGVLTEQQAEEIINHAAYSEDRGRMGCWLEREYPQLSLADRKYILGLKLKGFGRLSKRFLTEFYGAEKASGGEAHTILELLWDTNENLMQLLSQRYSFADSIQEFARDYYAAHPRNLADRLEDMYISNAVKRPIIRTLDVTEDVVKAMGCAPSRIFIEMARGGPTDQKPQRTKSRRQQLLELYRQIDSEEARCLSAELEAMGELADNRLQSDRLFLYYLQMGKCMYTGAPIDLSRLGDSKLYDIDHIYPQSKVSDNSMLNNKVLCLSQANGAKSDHYPIEPAVQTKMRSFWAWLLANDLITKEKHQRLTRSTGFTDDELHQFINRQLVETRQSTKAVAQLLKERYPETEIVYVKARLASDFRSEFDMLKSRAVNDLHHAKDAYLNIVVGNVYHEKFTGRFFDVHQEYSLNLRAMFCKKVDGVWQERPLLGVVRSTMDKNAIHLTRYAFCRKGQLFNLMPLKRASGLVPRKVGLDPEKYGGYSTTTASFYLLASYTIKGEKDVMFVPIELMYADKVKEDSGFALAYVCNTISKINGGKKAENVSILLNGRTVKINTVLDLDGMRVTISGKSSKGKQVGVASLMPLILGAQAERYVKRLERYRDKKKENPGLVLSEKYDGITPQDNIRLYALLCDKLTKSVYHRCPGNIGATVMQGDKEFAGLNTEDQAAVLLAIISWFGGAQDCNLTPIGGKPKSGAKVPSAKLSNWVGKYHDVRIVDSSSAGLHETRSENLLELL